MATKATPEIASDGVPTVSFRESKLSELPAVTRNREAKENPLTPVIKRALESGTVQEATGIATKEQADKVTTQLRNCARAVAGKTVASRYVDGVLYWQVTDVTHREKKEK